MRLPCPEGQTQEKIFGGKLRQKFSADRGQTRKFSLGGQTRIFFTGANPRKNFQPDQSSQMQNGKPKKKFSGKSLAALIAGEDLKFKGVFPGRNGVSQTKHYPLSG